MEIKIGDHLVVHSYKHDESLHRVWAKATVIDQSKNHIVLANRRTKVIEANGRFWYTKEPSVTWFFKDAWFNIIGIIRKDGIYFYCNIASPYLIDEEALKYIDYDLDIKVFPSLQYHVLDRKEYSRHQNTMDYPDDLMTILDQEVAKLKQWIENAQGPFTPGLVNQLYDRYKLIRD